MDFYVTSSGVEMFLPTFRPPFDCAQDRQLKGTKTGFVIIFIDRYLKIESVAFK